MRGIKRARRGKLAPMTLWLLGAAIVLLFGNAAVQPVLADLARQQAERLASEVVAESLLQLQEERPELFASLLCIEEHGDVTLLWVDATATNRLKSALTLLISDALAPDTELASGIPLGSLTRIQLLSGLGTEIPVRFRVTGAVSCDFRSEFKSGGLNQTVHRVTLDVRLGMVILLPLQTVSTLCSTNLLISETLLSAPVPFSGGAEAGAGETRTAPSARDAGSET